ncbi:MAG: hypothetical protein ACRCU2_13120 [Planktothrix sp.]
MAANLVFFGKQLTETPTVRKKIDDTKQAVPLTAAILSKKIPGLKALKPETLIYRISKYKEDYTSQTLSVYKSDDGKVGVYTPDFELVEGCQFISFTAAIKGTAVIKIKEEQFTINFPPSAYFMKEVKEITEGEGEPHSDLVKAVPHKMTNWENLSKDESYTVIKTTGPDLEHYETERYLIKDSTEATFEVHETESLKEHIANCGIKEPFKIGTVTKKEITDKKSKQKRKITLVKLLSVDFSDLPL